MTVPPQAVPEPQAVLAPLSRSALLLVAMIGTEADDAAQVRAFCADVSGLVRAVGFRDPDSALSCVVGFGARAWPRLFGAAPPPGLHPFRPMTGERHTAPSTPGDVVFHIRAARLDLCFELANQILVALGNAVLPVDEVQGFRFFDNRDLLGFVDGTENPTGAAASLAAVIPAAGPESDFAGGSYVMVQKYVHDLDSWNALDVAAQERIIGRAKLSNVELADDATPSSAHRMLTTVTDAGGTEVKILRDNMPFGSPAAHEFGTLFIGYASGPDVLETMLRNMFVGDPPGNYDRLLDFSTAETGGLFFVPSAPMLDALAESAPDQAPAQIDPATPDGTLPPAAPDGTLAIGSLKGT
ncbi:MAG TPA: Dyp-type peroxidase [Pseudonocardia sp.]